MSGQSFKNLTLEAIAQEINERVEEIELCYWCPDDELRNPNGEHIFGIMRMSPVKIAGIEQDVILQMRTMRLSCNHTHHNVELNGTILKIGDCLEVDLNDPMSIPVIVQFYTPVVKLI